MSVPRGFSDEEILELTYITCMYDMQAVMSKALRTEFDDRDDPIVEVAAPRHARDRARSAARSDRAQACATARSRWSPTPGARPSCAWYIMGW